jgi:DNA-binding MurR/RpiR family transcriptional regulator
MKNSVHAATSTPEVAFAASQLGKRLIEAQGASSRSNRLIADYLLRNPVRAAAWSIEDLAQAIAVSTATISRFARMMGFAGYPELRAGIAETLQSVFKPVEKLRDAIARKSTDASPLDHGLEATLQAVRSAASGLTKGSLDSLVVRLQQARTVYVLGFGLSAHIAGILTLGLQPFCPQLINVVEFGGTEVAAGRLMNVGKGDIVIAISFPRYAADALHLVAYAHDRGAEIAAITDSPASPLARHARWTLYAPSAHPVLPSSLASAIVAVEALLTALMTSSTENVAQAAKLTEAISAYLVRAEEEMRPVARGKKTRKRAR